MHTRLTESQSRATQARNARLLALSREHWGWLRKCRADGIRVAAPARMLAVRANLWGLAP